MSALAETWDRLGEYAQWHVAHFFEPITAEKLKQYSAIVRDINDFFATLQQQGEQQPDDPHMVAWAALLRESAGRVLAVAGPDASWASPEGQPDRIILSERDSDRLAAVLDNPPAPNDALRFAAKRYRAMIGL